MDGYSPFCRGAELKGTLEETISDLNHVESTVAQIERKPAMFPHISDVRKGCSLYGQEEGEGDGVGWGVKVFGAELPAHSLTHARSCLLPVP